MQVVNNIMWNSNEPIKAAHIRKLANQSICNWYQRFYESKKTLGNLLHEK